MLRLLTEVGIFSADMIGENGELTASATISDEFVLKVKWDNMKTFYDCMLRISSTDPVNYSVYSANIDLRPAGK